MTLKDFKKVNQNALYFAIFLEQYVGGIAQSVVASSRILKGVGFDPG